MKKNRNLGIDDLVRLHKAHREFEVDVSEDVLQRGEMHFLENAYCPLIFRPHNAKEWSQKSIINGWRMSKKGRFSWRKKMWWVNSTPFIPWLTWNRKNAGNVLRLSFVEDLLLASQCERLGGMKSDREREKSDTTARVGQHPSSRDTSEEDVRQ